MIEATGESLKSRAAKLDGARVAEEIKREVAADAQKFRSEFGAQPCLAVVRVGDDPASQLYVQSKMKACEELGLTSEQHILPEKTDDETLLKLITNLNRREEVDGILVQLPLPRSCDERLVTEAISPEKDVDGFHPVNVGRLALKRPALVPCTPAGIIELLVREGVELRGANACVVGRSHIVGHPVAELLLQRDATVTICHSRTKNLPDVTKQADILIAAIGRAAFIRAEHVKPGATVVDVGINRVSDVETVRELFGERADKRLEGLKKRGFTIVGDVHPTEAEKVAGRLTPVPGGVGLLTVAMLMKNTLSAARQRRSKEGF